MEERYGDVDPTSSDFDPESSFDAAARDFDRLGVHLWQPIAVDTLAHTQPATGERVLDACCGDGASAIPTARLVGEQGLVDAVDLAPGMISALETKATELPQLHPICADVEDWDRGDYDLVQCVLGIFFLPDMEAGTKALIDRVRPGGRFGATIWRSGAMELIGLTLADVVCEACGQEKPAPSTHLITRVNNRELFTTWLGGCGLAEVQVAEVPRALPLTPDLAWLTVMGSGFVGALQEFTPGEVEQVRTEFLARLRESGETEIDATTLVASGRRIG